MRVIVEGADARTLESFERVVSVDDVPQAVRALAPAIASAALGEPRSEAPSAPAVARSLETERALQLGVAALERQDLAEAHRQLSAAIALDPALAEAHYHLALVEWWRTPASEDELEAITRALTGPLDADKRDFLLGLRLLVEQKHPDALTYFRALAARAPEHRDVHYGWFEAAFHGGAVEEAERVFTRLQKLAPRFHLGVRHALELALLRADAARVDSILERWRPASPDDALWRARALVSTRALADAASLLERALEDTTRGAPVQAALLRELIEVYVLRGQIALAGAAYDKLAQQDPGAAALPGYALSVARQKPDAALRAKAEHAAGLGVTDSSSKTWEGGLTLDALDLARADLDRIRARSPRPTLALGGRTLEVDVGALLLHGALEDPAVTEGALADAARASPFPEVAHVGLALAAERRADPRSAMTHWRDALARSFDARLRILEALALARAAERAGDDAAARAACDDATLPRRFSWAVVGARQTCDRVLARGRTP